jgi:hypothetical protein
VPVGDTQMIRHSSGELEKDPEGCGRNVSVHSIYTIAVAASNHDGSVHELTPDCPAVMVTAYSTTIHSEQTSAQSTVMPKLVSTCMYII